MIEEVEVVEEEVIEAAEEAVEVVVEEAEEEVSQKQRPSLNHIVMKVFLSPEEKKIYW